MMKNRKHKMRLVRSLNVRKVRQTTLFAQSNNVRRSVVVVTD
jgi:hypothetical protein